MEKEWRFPNRATPVGSSSYYSVRIAPNSLRDDLAALLGWRHQVRAVLDEVSDPGVARLKLQWWRDELARTFADEPRHPLSQVLGEALKRHALPDSPFFEMADRAEAEILRRQPTTEADLVRTCEQDLGALFELVARCHGLSDTGALGTARSLGGFCAQVYLIRDCGALVRKGRFSLPAETLHAQGLPPDAAGHHQHRSRLPTLISSEAIRARSALLQPGARRKMPASIRARVRILEVLLDEIESEGFDVANQRVGLTPLRKLWLAWRENRRE